MQGVRRKSLHATLRLVFFAIVAGVLFATQVLAQQQPTTFANDPTAATQLAQSADEAAFKQMLVKNSPWNVTWKGAYSTGTQNMSFALSADGALTGKLFNLSAGGRDATLKEIIVKDGRVNFVSVDTGTKFEYRLNSDSTLSGVLNGMTMTGNRWEATAVAKPAGR